MGAPYGTVTDGDNTMAPVVDVTWDEAEAESTRVSGLRFSTQCVARPKRDRSRSASTTS